MRFIPNSKKQYKDSLYTLTELHTMSLLRLAGEQIVKRTRISKIGHLTTLAISESVNFISFIFYLFFFWSETHGSPQGWDGDEIKIRKGDSASGDAIDLPDPRVCNLHLAVARVATSGLGDVFDECCYYEGDLSLIQGPV
jgi:hypothetical protein